MMRPVSRCELIALALLACGSPKSSEPAPARRTDEAEPASTSLEPPEDLRSPPTTAQRSPSGLVSVVLREGRGSAKPRSFDRVQVHYTGWSADGAVFASTRTRNAPVTFVVDEVIPGWSEGIMLMRQGELRRLWIPRELGYRDEDEPKGPLVMDVELLGIAERLPPAPAPPDLHAPPPSAQRTVSGLVHRELAPRSNDRRAEPHDRVRIVYVGWNLDGRVIDSSAPRGAYAEVLAGHGSPGFREAISLLHEGEARRFWIPEALAWKSHAMTVQGPLVFDIELVEILDMPGPPPTPSDVASPPKNAVRTASGLAYRVLERGLGTRKPSIDSAVEVHYSYWSTDGRLIDSTVPNMQPHRTAFKDRDLAPGVIEALLDMVVGERRRLWVPESLGFSGQQKPAPGMLVFDVELVSVYAKKRRIESIEDYR